MVRGVGLAGRAVQPEAADDDAVGEGHDADGQEEEQNGDDGEVQLARRVRVLRHRVHHLAHVRPRVGAPSHRHV